jgi:hypothetical protein
MLKLVESLAVKAKRAKSTTVVFVPLSESGVSHRCSWCGQFAKGKGWNGYRAVDQSYPRGGLAVAGDVCSDRECREAEVERLIAAAGDTRHGHRNATMVLIAFRHGLRPHMLRHVCGYKLANQGVDTRTLQDYLGHRNIQHTVRYTKLSESKFKNLWPD